MMKVSYPFFVVGILLILFFSMSCSDKSTTADQLTDNDEATVEPMPADLTQYVEERGFSDNQLTGKLLEELTGENSSALSTYDIYAVTFIWGSLLNPSASGTQADWSGTLSTNAVGSVDMVYPIDFENEDNPSVVSDILTEVKWISSAGNGDIDGIICMVAVDRSVEYFAQPMLTITTDQFIHSFDFEELEDFAGLFPVDQDNAVGVVSKLLWKQSCEGGIISGEWTKIDLAGDSGSISGLWYDYAGNLVGTMAGSFTTMGDGEKRFLGWVSGGITTQVILEFEGKWGFDDYRMCPMCGAGHGIFWGRYKYLNEDKYGYIQGTFGDYSLPLDQLDLPITGIWQDKCKFSLYPDIE